MHFLYKRHLVFTDGDRISLPRCVYLFPCKLFLFSLRFKQSPVLGTEYLSLEK